MQYFPYVLAAMIGVEQSLGAGNGATKKQLVLNAVTAVASVGEQVPESHVAGISNLIDSTAVTLKAANLFGFGSSVTPAVPVAAPTTTTTNS